MNEYSFWTGILVGVFPIVYGLYSILRPSSIANWLKSQGLPHSSVETTFLRQIRTLGVLFILAGGFFVFVVIRNHY